MNAQNKTNKSIIIIILMAVVLLGVGVILVQCYLFAGASDAHPYLSAGDWSRIDEVTGEGLNITFTEDGEYFYACDCGEPVGDSDLYDSYAYNAKTGIITLSGPDGEKAEAKLVYCDDNYLCLVIDQAFELFEDLDSPPAAEPHESALNMLPEASPALAILGFDKEKNTLTVAPGNYDRDAAESFKDAVTELELSERPDFYNVSVIIENGEARVSKSPIMPKSYAAIGEDYTYGYVTFDDEGRVNGAVFYGETVIEG